VTPKHGEPGPRQTISQWAAGQVGAVSGRLVRELLGPMADGRDEYELEVHAKLENGRWHVYARATNYSWLRDYHAEAPALLDAVQDALAQAAYENS
jgi:hypothetical protein